MREAILAINVGSSSVKFAAYEVRPSEPALLFRGMEDDRSGTSHFAIHDPAGKPIEARTSNEPELASKGATTLLSRIEPLLVRHKLVAVGHRIVHGGPEFSAPVPIDADILRKLDE